jgi:hypothetical protein
MIDYSAILATNYADQQWSLNGDTYEGLEWFSDTPKPTQAELDAQWPAVNYANQCATVEKTRHANYIKTSDPIFFEWQRGTKTQADWDAAVQAIKDANPYPTAP